MEQPVEITPDVLNEIDEQYNEYQFIQVRDMAYQDGRIIVTPDDTTEKQAFLMDVDAREYLSEFIGLPSHYVSKIDDPQIASILWNYHIRKRGSDIDVLKLMASREGVAKSFTTKAFRPLRPSEVLLACRTAMPDAMLERYPYIHGRKVDFALTCPSLYEEFANTLGMKSDVHHFSVGVEFDFSGGDSPVMKAYGNRHSCGNRMESGYGVTGKQFRIFSTDATELIAKFTENARKGFEFIRNTMIPKVRATMEARMPEAANEIAELAKAYGLNERVQDLVMEAYRTEDLGGTTYHLVNAITRAANSDRCPTNVIRTLHQMAGAITVSHDPAAPPRRCEQCHQKIKHSHKERPVIVTEPEPEPTN